MNLFSLHIAALLAVSSMKIRELFSHLSPLADSVGCFELKKKKIIPAAPIKAECSDRHCEKQESYNKIVRRLAVKRA